MLAIDTHDSGQRHINAGAKEDRSEGQNDSLQHVSCVQKGIIVSKCSTKVSECFKQSTYHHRYAERPCSVFDSSKGVADGYDGEANQRDYRIREIRKV